MLKQKWIAVLMTVLLMTGLLAVDATPVAAAGYSLPEDTVSPFILPEPV